ncbi:MAG: N-acetylmuramoyl-L-alanine amidase [Actinomycetota bacterium]|nr:N-acetylmuramoyl-L-alanine amidase [Actinomycetota bacterium]
MRLIKLGSRGKEVEDIQSKLAKLDYDVEPAEGQALFDEKTLVAVKTFQQDRGLVVDGIVGEETWRELVEANLRLGDRLLYLKSPYLRGDDVRQLQKWLNRLGFSTGAVDGIFGPTTEAALIEFQKNLNLAPDGMVGRATMEAFHNLRSILDAEYKIAFPWEDRLKGASAISLLGELKVAVDFGHGYPPDPGAVGPSGLKESEAAEDLGLRLGALLTMFGSRVIYTREVGQFVGLSERAALANRKGADIFISFHLNGSTNPKAEGTSTYYFAGGDQYSRAGRDLATNIHNELLVALGRPDDRIHGKNFSVLRETKMPAVLLEPLFITNPHEEALLADEKVRQRIAVAVFDGVKKYLNS